MIRPQTLASIARANMGQHDVLVPEFKGQHGHPVRFTRIAAMHWQHCKEIGVRHELSLLDRPKRCQLTMQEP